MAVLRRLLFLTALACCAPRSLQAAAPPSKKTTIETTTSYLPTPAMTPTTALATSHPTPVTSETAHPPGHHTSADASDTTSPLQDTTDPHRHTDESTTKAEEPHRHDESTTDPHNDHRHDESSTTHDPHGHDDPSKKDDHHDTTSHPDDHRHAAPPVAVRRKTAPLHIQESTWGYVPFVVGGVFVAFMLMGRKFKALGNVSLRLWLIQFISIETLYKTLGGADHHEYKEQRAVEIGHQAFVLLGVAFLTASFIWNEVSGNEQRYAFYILQLVQMALLLANVVFDCVMIHLGHLRSVRSLNTKLRFAHCTYQVFLFCTDVISSGVTALPVDCYVWATIHYSYESVGLLLEGLNVIGMSDIAIIVLVNARAMTNTIDATGALCAFGMTCLILSCVSLVAGMLWKAVDATRYPRFQLEEEGHDDHSSSGPHRHTNDNGEDTFVHSERSGSLTVQPPSSQDDTEMMTPRLQRPQPPPSQPPQSQQAPASRVSNGSLVRRGSKAPE